MTSRDELFEEVAAAFQEHEDAPTWQDDPVARDAALRWHMRGFRDALAALEKAHAPTDDYPDAEGLAALRAQSAPTARHTFDSDDCVTRECDCANRQGEPTDAQLSEIEQRVYDEHRGMVAGFAKVLIRAGWAAAVREGGRP